MMEPIEIVRKLAAENPVGYDKMEDAYCTLCDASEYGTSGLVELGDPANHKTGCPWRLAHEHGPLPDGSFCPSGLQAKTPHDRGACVSRWPDATADDES